MTRNLAEPDLDDCGAAFDDLWPDDEDKGHDAIGYASHDGADLGEPED